ncbi:MAG TPA: hypothetical protein VFC79_04050 [Tissierellaceae bacterium]|nr:hypothetical protein [Tissierellaceae bacterium]
MEGIGLCRYKTRYVLNLHKKVGDFLDAQSIKQYIIDNPHYIENILEDAGFYKIRNTNRDEYRCAFDMDTNSTSVRVDKNTLASSDFGRGVSGDIITLVRHKTKLKFREALQLICKSIGLNMSNMPKRVAPVLPFGGFFKNIGINKDKYDILEPIDDSVLNEFALMPSKMFLDDGVSIEQQLKYNIGYDVISGRIIIPHWDTLGRLVGIMGRYNKVDINDDILKYLPIIPFPKSKIVYNYHHSYASIQEKGIAIIGESEKSPLKLNNMGIHVGLALGGNTISPTQVRNIQSASPKIAILGLDEGLKEDYVVHEAEKLQLNNPFINIKVGYIWDANNEIMKKGSKVAPMDKSKAEFQYLMKNCVKWI